MMKANKIFTAMCEVFCLACLIGAFKNSGLIFFAIIAGMAAAALRSDLKSEKK